MQDKLKQYVEERRNEFEMHEPREQLWNDINVRLSQDRRNSAWQKMAIAASLLLAISCGTWFYIASPDKSTITKTRVPPNPPITGAEVYYTTIVQMKDAQLEQYCSPQPELCREFEKDLETLVNAYSLLKKEYAVSADKDRILDAMKVNLQMQVQLISQQLKIMETVKQKREQINNI